MEKLPKVRDVMDKTFLKLNQSTSINEAIKTLDKNKLFGACIVNDNEEVIGILSEKQCLIVFRNAISGDSDTPLDQITVKSVMYPEFTTIPSSIDIVEATQIFMKHPFRRMPVVDSGVLVGQITRRDLVRAIQKFGII